MTLNAIYRLSLQHAHPHGPWQAILGAVESHHAEWLLRQERELAGAATATLRKRVQLDSCSQIYKVLDLASGPRGEPGTTIAHALPFAAVHCTDSCPQMVSEIPLLAIPSATVATLDHAEAGNTINPIPAPPKNLTKSVQDLTDLSAYCSNSMDAIVCSYGYGLSKDIQKALREAHRVLIPGGILVIASWQQSSLSSIGRDVLAYVRSGGQLVGGQEGRDGDDEALFLPSLMPPVEEIELSGLGELEALLLQSGFITNERSHLSPLDAATKEAIRTTRNLTYPFDMGSTSKDQFELGTILIRADLKALGAFEESEFGNAGGWNSLAEEGFWMNIRQYTKVINGAMILQGNVFKLTVSTKSSTA